MTTTAHKSTFDRDAQFARKRRAVIRSAGQAFRRRGYHNASMAEIARSLGLSKAALYYYVSSKAEILHACHIGVYDAMDSVLKIRRAAGQSALDDLSQIFQELVELLTRDGLSLLTDVDSLSGEAQAEVLSRRGKIERRITKIVKTGMADGSIRGADPRLTVYFFMGALNWLNAWYDTDGRVGPEDIAAHFVAQMRGGISA